MLRSAGQGSTGTEKTLRGTRRFAALASAISGSCVSRGELAAPEKMVS
jgi:hypothetical protein